MIRKYFKFLSITVVLVVFIASCAQIESESNDVIQKRILEAWVSTNYGSAAKVTKSGSYILESIDGTGEKVRDSSYVFVSYSTKSLDGTYVTTTYEDIAKQLGTYTIASYYGAYIWGMDLGAVYTGIEEILKDMRVGGKIKVVVPPWLTDSITTELYSTPFSSSGETSNIIFEMEVNKVVDNIYEYQRELLEEYSNKYYGGIDSISDGFYLKKEIELPDGDTIVDGETINVRYIARLLNGHVFDTNIQDTAKKYRIYDSSNDYDALEMTFNTDLSEMVSANDVVYGFSYAVNKMKYGESAVTFFWSPLGYYDSGSEGVVPGYTPLKFNIYVEPKDD